MLLHRSNYSTVRLLVLVEAAGFTAASLIHSGVLIAGYEHPSARTAEAVIAAVLYLCLAVTGVRPSWTRVASLIAQGFALFGTLVGLFTIAVGVGPRTIPDLVFHGGIVVVLVWGLIVAASMRVQTGEGQV